MPRPSDERLIAYLDGELGENERAEIAHRLEQDAELRERAAQFSESGALVRAAFDETLHEPVPERLLAAARHLRRHHRWLPQALRQRGTG